MSPLYTTVTARAESADAVMATVTFREKIRVDTRDGLRNLLPAETYLLSYSLIAQVLVENLRILYFEESSDQRMFLELYPEFRGKI